ncbi:MAG: ATP-binding protein [bacterium]|nr:ATP-binding protein [bacterium]
MSGAVYFIAGMAFMGLLFVLYAGNKNSTVNIIFHSLSMIILVFMFEKIGSNRLYAGLFVLIILINISIFAVHEIAFLRGKEMQEIINEKEKHDSELDTYRLLYEKYENTRIMRHDMKEQLRTLYALIEDNNEEAKRYIEKLDVMVRNLDFTEYTDNNVLNILLDRKIRECGENEIKLSICSNGVSMKFMPELDTVSVFSNLINNAMESCLRSEEKNIFIDLSTMNNSFVVVRVENNCDEEPVEVNGAFRTHKTQSDMHGIGLRSIKSSIKPYNGKITMNYDAENKFFRTVILLDINGGKI